MRWRLSAVVALAGVAGACSLDELSSGFGAPVGDGGPDGPAEGFCASHRSATFCDDFDDGHVLERWDETTRVGGGVLRVDAEDARSAPNSLRVEIPAGTPDFPVAFVTTESAAIATQAKLTFALKTADLTRVLERAPTCTIASADGRHVVRLVVGRMTFVNEIAYNERREVVLGINMPTAFALRPNEWMTIALEVSLTPPGHLRLTIDGATAIDEPLAGGWEPGPTRALVGVYYAEGTTAPWTMRIDDVVYDVR